MDKLTISEFCDQLGTNTPTPGGGSVSSLAGALAVSLTDMVIAYTLNNPRYSELKEEFSIYYQKGLALKDRLLALMDKDAQGFLPLSQVYKLPKDHPDRAEKYNEALKIAMEAPLAMFNCLLEVIELSLEVYQKANRMLISDAQVALHLALAALKSSAVMVEVNLKNLEEAAELSTYLKTNIQKYESRINDLWQ